MQKVDWAKEHYMHRVKLRIKSLASLYHVLYCIETKQYNHSNKMETSIKNSMKELCMSICDMLDKKE